MSEKIRIDYYGMMTLDGKPQGKGIIKWSDGHKYEGEVSNIDGKAIRHGHGEMIFPPNEKYPEGMKYVGEWKNDKQEGQGKFIWIGLAEINGEYKNGLPNGYGEQIYYTHGGKYSGTFKDGLKEGKGTLTFPNGETYTGDWVSDIRHGNGKMKYADGVEYEGEFQNNQRHGKGKQNNPEAGVYVGEFEFNQYNGYGTLTFDDGRKIVGNWKNAIPVGQMSLINKDGTSKEALWDDENKKYIYIDKGKEN